MWKWIGRLLVVAVVGFFGFAAYQDYRWGYFDLPDFNTTSYAITFKSGLRAIVVDPEVVEPRESLPSYFRRLRRANPDRRYIAAVADVPSWFKDTWAFCHPPTDEERAAMETDMPYEWQRNLIGARFEAVCKIDVDGESIMRGLIYSVPRQ